ncbi:MAG: FHA domain-containing protein [Bacteroidales bacterium]|nr:FHA domain-containing protein [Bacteroidales bacterium]
MWCPDCKRPKPNRGRECPVCGSDLVPGRKYLNGNPPQPQSAEAPQPVHPARLAPQATATATPSEPTKMVGNGWTLPLREGQFGRTSGIYPEFASCKYVSGNHGRLERSGSNWMVIDNGSTNGTYINGLKLTPGVGVPLRIGDKLIVATVEFDIL